MTNDQSLMKAEFWENEVVQGEGAEQVGAGYELHEGRGQSCGPRFDLQERTARLENGLFSS